MKADPYFHGQALALLAFEQTTDLYPQLRLSISDKKGLQAFCFECAMKVPDAAYRAHDDLWSVHFDTLYREFWNDAESRLFKDDIDALRTWFARGDLSPPGGDLGLEIWLRSLSIAFRKGWDSDGLHEDAVSQINHFIQTYVEEWRSEDFVDAIDALRDAPDTEASMILKTKFNINMYDDVDPLLALIGARKGNVLVENVKKLPAEFPFDTLARVSEPWLIENASSFSESNRQEAEEIAKDIRCVIRG